MLWAVAVGETRTWDSLAVREIKVNRPSSLACSLFGISVNSEGGMVMAQISVTPEELKSQAQVYVQSKDEVDQAIQRVSSMNGTIAEEWKGQAFQAYLEQYDQLHQSVVQFENLLERVYQQLNKYADTVAERDAQDAQSFGF
jgi:WXG100 family type VII secretion target